MKTMCFIQKLVAVVALLGVIGVGGSSGQPLAAQSYRKPSESDVAWLLGNGNAQEPIVSCKPMCCGELRNPACCCVDCAPPKAVPTPASQEEKNKTVETSHLPTPSSIRQVGHVVESSETVEPGTIENEDAAPPTSPILPASTRKSAFPTVVKPLKELPARPPTETPKKLKTLSSVSSDSLPSPCSCSNCVAKKTPCNDSTVPCERTPECKKKYCRSSFGISDDLSDWLTSLHRTRTRHGACCTCPCCLVFDVPDMTGDTGGIPYRFIAVSNNSSLFEQSQPTFVMSRLNLVEHFNLEAKNRVWFDYRHLSDGVEWNPVAGRSRAVDHFTVGLEKKLSTVSSLEFRLPIINQLSSGQPNGGESAEIGNLSLTYKYMFLRTQDFTFGGGLAVVCPTAENWSYAVPNVKATYKNGAVNLIPYWGVLWHPDDAAFGQLLLQADIPVSKNSLQLDHRSLDVREPSLFRAGLQLGRWFYRNEKGRQSCRLGGFVEVNYTAAFDNSSFVVIPSVGNPANGLTLFSTKNKPQVLTLGGGIPVQFGKLSIINALVAPIADNRSFSIAYDFSLCRRF